MKPYLVSCVRLERVGLQLVVGLQAEPVAVRGRLRGQEVGGEVRGEVVLAVGLDGSQVASVSANI